MVSLKPISKKRTAAESSNDAQTTDDSDLSQQQGDAKRAKLVSLSDTTLQDLPIELLECILVKAIALEVKDMKFAKSVWKAKSDRVINRLCAVSLQWSSICANKVFRKKVHRTLDDTVQETIRFEMLHQYPLQFLVYDMTCVNDEIFLLCRPIGEGVNRIKVMDCSNTAVVKDVIPLPGIRSSCIEGCNISNCVYVLNSELLETDADSILRITKVGEHQFTLSPWIASDQKLSLLTVSANGNLITLSKHEIPKPAVVSVYAADGPLQHKIVLYPDICGHATIENVIQKSNGNLVLFSEGQPIYRAHIREIDPFGSIVRQYQSSLRPEFSVNFADINDRILITNGNMEFELLDSEFNLLDVAPVQPNDAQVFLPPKLNFNYEKNEIMSDYNCSDPSSTGLAFFRFI